VFTSWLSSNHRIYRFFVLLSLLWPPACFRYGFAQSEDHQTTRPLPDLNSFLEKMKENVRSDRLLLSRYTFTMQEINKRLDKNGAVKKTETRTYEIYPSLEEDETYQRLISENGVPVDPKKIREQDRKYNKKAHERARKLARDQRSDHERRLAKEAEELGKEKEVLDDLFALFEFVILRREILDGHSAILIQFAPNRQFRPKTDNGKLLKKFRGTALISETDCQVIHVEAELIDTVSIGFGLIARIHKGSRFVFTRKKINNEIWLPAEFHFVGSIRALLFKHLRIESIRRFSDYEKFTVSSTFEFLSGDPFKR
jgi:hypothetical protein